MAPDAGIKLRAEDAADLAVISACLQDALVSVRDLAFDRDERRFVLIANRFRWERNSTQAAKTSGHQRTLCGIAFAEVDGVAYRGFRRSEEDRILSLLAVQLHEQGRVIELDFSAGVSIRLAVARISCHARDLGEPWPTAWQPDHAADDQPTGSRA
ncbi:MAG TPA: DUF2948 family protein [Stellaceae bacterium]|nr:DUF2948 family protein [Stellaceae bacterium]